ncbi:FAD-dependent thiol oxidase [Tilletiopsis washingtonensis]|uniref:Sulfhydryl oxidase n=1 Tax=Tilletiopsis washingtonensis TaxID=58919 RepID=A0A316Z4Z4_9BASI|nr:FAD-dependent thiol oxidase [Tilletiopsis washingtonensis]PWN96426.1 FAD-dependent thiol oxidase [Tilletiopsis washingtonensis]
MPTFSSRPIRPRGRGGLAGTVQGLLRRRPFLVFGLPFLLTIAGGSYGLSYLTQTKFDYNATKVRSMDKAEELGMRKDRRRIDIREEYFRLESAQDGQIEDWEPKRIERPAGTPEWGVAPESSRRGVLHADERPADTPDPFAGQTAKTARSGSSTKKPGVVLGPDGKPCRACNSKLAFAQAMKGTGATAKAPASSPSAGPSAGGAAAAGAAAAMAMAEAADECPPDGEALGRGTWAFLHSAAAYYPATPSPIQRESMLALLRALPHVYPCAPCAESLGEELEREARAGRSHEGGPALADAVHDGPSLRRWLCGVHNEVNERLGKKKVPCTEEVLQARWRDGPPDGRCDA